MNRCGTRLVTIALYVLIHGLGGCNTPSIKTEPSQKKHVSTNINKGAISPPFNIHTIIKTAQYSDPQAGDWITRCLIERRDKIGRHYFEKVLPLDHFRLEGTRLEFEDLAVRHGFHPAREYSVKWFEFDNITGRHQSIASQGNGEIPEKARAAQEGAYYSAEISAGEPEKMVTVYMRKEGDSFKVVGIERSWPGKIVMDAPIDKGSLQANKPGL